MITRRLALYYLEVDFQEILKINEKIENHYLTDRQKVPRFGTLSAIFFEIFLHRTVNQVLEIAIVYQL